MPKFEPAPAGFVIDRPYESGSVIYYSDPIRQNTANNINKNLASFSSTASFKRRVFSPLAPPASSLGSEVGTASDFFSSFSCSGVGRKDFSSVATGVNRDLEKGFVQLASWLKLNRRDYRPNARQVIKFV